MSRKLPVFLVLDCSESMVGEPMRAVEEGARAMVAALRSDPHALEMAALSVIAFSGTARVVVPMTEVYNFMFPSLPMGSGTGLGAALDLLRERLDADVVRSTPERKGDFKPLVFILTDGEPTDRWQEAADRFRREIAGRRANVVAVVCGDEASAATMHRVTEQVILAKNLDAATLTSLFRWVSASVAMASQSVHGPAASTFGGDLVEATPSDLARGPAPERRLFLHARCRKDKRFYIASYRRAGEGRSERYLPVAAHLVPDFDHASSATSAAVASDRIHGASACPSCGDPGWACCSCGKILCCPSYEGSVTMTCPWCGLTGDYSAASFDVGRGAG
jgi:uncharacterized protein YegL